jgi:hypothetical protein
VVLSMPDPGEATTCGQDPGSAHEPAFQKSHAVLFQDIFDYFDQLIRVDRFFYVPVRYRIFG